MTLISADGDTPEERHHRMHRAHRVGWANLHPVSLVADALLG
ncbi:hypothetical protein [Polaromonas eurypsychrophila]|nr:hypothetical protein [Polaromonas eurypsychrophila]